MCINHAVHLGGGSASSTLTFQKELVVRVQDQSHTEHMPADQRRRSVDVGGLALALGAVSLGDGARKMGKGWGGWEDSELSGSQYAELLSDMYTKTQSAVNQSSLPPFPVISACSRRRLIDMLDGWHFEPHKLPEEEVMACALLLFETLFQIDGMQETANVTLTQLSSFLVHLRQAYRATNSYHNFHHAVDVFQATHMYLRMAGAVPPVAILNSADSIQKGQWRPHDEVRGTWIGILRQCDIFSLYIAAIGHDVGHPGFNNMFMKNAQAPLSQVYDHKSALEQMHCAFLLPIMKQHGLAHLLGQSPKASQFRRLLLDTVLATDMGVHKQFMDRFATLMERAHEFDIMQARTLLCQALIKCADISNPSRPHTVSQHWSAALASEWASQALLEKQLCLPVSVQDLDDPTKEAEGQISFITIFCLPLLEATSEAIPEMKVFVDQCAINCKLWRQRLVELKEKSERCEPSYPPIPYRSAMPLRTLDYESVFPLSLPPHFSLSMFRDSSVDRSYLSMAIDPLTKVIPGQEKIASASDCRMFERPSNFRENISDRSGGKFVEDTGSIPSSSRSTSPSNYVVPNLAFAMPPFYQGHGTVSLSFAATAEFSLSADSASDGLSPRSDFTPRTPSTGAINGQQNINVKYFPASESISSIRAAYKLSVRKKRSFHRNSWAPSLSSRAPHVPMPNAGVTGEPYLRGDEITISAQR